MPETVFPPAYPNFPLLATATAQPSPGIIPLTANDAPWPASWPVITTTRAVVFSHPQNDFIVYDINVYLN